MRSAHILQASAIATGEDVLTLGIPEVAISTSSVMVLSVGIPNVNQMQLNPARKQSL